MAATITRLVPFFNATKALQLRHGLYNGPTSYATGGESLPPEQFSLGYLHQVFFEPAANSARTLIRFPRYSHATAKVQWFEANGNEVAAAVNLTDYGARFVAYGH